jgi:hypothetical protein
MVRGYWIPVLDGDAQLVLRDDLNRSTPMPIEGYCWPLSAFPGETLEFKVSSPSSYQVTFLRLKAQPGGGLGVPMAPAESFPASAQTTAADW